MRAFNFTEFLVFHEKIYPVTGSELTTIFPWKPLSISFSAGTFHVGANWMSLRNPQHRKLKKYKENETEKKTDEGNGTVTFNNERRGWELIGRQAWSSHKSGP